MLVRTLMLWVGANVGLLALLAALDLLLLTRKLVRRSPASTRKREESSPSVA